jgi:hypothetical protein
MELERTSFIEHDGVKVFRVVEEGEKEAHFGNGVIGATWSNSIMWMEREDV